MIEGFQFHSPTRVLFGEGIVSDLGEELTRYGKRRCLIVTEKVLREIGLLDRIVAACRTPVLECAGVFDEVVPNAWVGAVRKGLGIARELGVDLLVAVGGGSAIDTAKAINVGLAHGGDPMDYQGAQNLPGPCKPLVVVPTTAGTGSEVSNVAVVYDDAVRSKVLLVDNNLMPDLALLDPAMTVSMPPRLTAGTGMDALTHAIESFVSIGAFPLADALGIRAVEMISNNLLRAVTDGKDLHARSQMLLASCMAGIAFTQAGVGCVHAMSHSLGALAKVPHGEANAIMLPFGMEYNLHECPDRFADLSRALGVRETRGIDLAEAGRKAIERVRQLLLLLKQHSGLPVKLSEAGVREEALAEVAAASLVDGAMMYNRRPGDEASILESLQRAL